ncbi:MbcA/ParS/Xre antitoxin family protein [Altericroceibacterium endophyticum]|nr:MbcA/ParS/Xre antitoxin family protein [Altericroceibacterium endophyticum]
MVSGRTLYGGDLVQTIHFMNRRHYWLGGETPIERAEQSEEGLAFILDMIGAIDAGVYL